MDATRNLSRDVVLPLLGPTCSSARGAGEGRERERRKQRGVEDQEPARPVRPMTALSNVDMLSGSNSYEKIVEDDQNSISVARRGLVIGLSSTSNWRITIDRRVVLADHVRERALRLDESIEGSNILSDVRPCLPGVRECCFGDPGKLLTGLWRRCLPSIV